MISRELRHKAVSIRDFVVAQNFQRIRYQPSEARKRTSACSLSLPEGDWVVWWYSRLQRNGMDHTVPLALVIFRRLDGDRLTSDFVTRRIALSRLCFYQPGYILVDNEVAERIELETKWIDVNFKWDGDHWKFREIPTLGLTLPNSPYLLPISCIVDWAMVFKTGEGKNLILNCIEFLVRGFSRRSEIPRILATYDWHEVEDRLFAKNTPNEEKIPYGKKVTGSDKWIVYPDSDMVKDDDLLLAHIANDKTYAAHAAREVFSQLNNAEFRSGKAQPILVKPWFIGETKLKCRGFEVDNNFYCTELIGIQEPSGIAIEARRDHLSRTPTPEERLEQERLILLRSDPMTLALTDLNQPRSLHPREEVEDSSFEVIKNRVVNRVKVPKLSGRRRTLRDHGPEVEDYSTGDPAGQRNDTTAKVVLATREFGINSQGVLHEIWKSFQRLKSSQQIQNLWWFEPPDKKHSGSDFKCIEFRIDLTDKARSSWLTLKNGGTRGLQLILVRVNNIFYLVVEIERNSWITKNGDYTEDSFSGLICEVADSKEAAMIVAGLDEHLPGHKGVFKKLKIEFPNQAEIFEHRPTGNPDGWFDATAVLALAKMGVKISRPTGSDPLEPELD